MTADFSAYADVLACNGTVRVILSVTDLAALCAAARGQGLLVGALEEFGDGSRTRDIICSYGFQLTLVQSPADWHTDDDPCTAHEVVLARSQR